MVSQGSTGGGINSLNDETSMTTSQFMEQVKYVSVEQELARSISQIASIKSARVHLATTKESAFVRNRTPAKASVVVTPHSGRVVSGGSQVEAIVHMVSSSVPHLDADSVVVLINEETFLLMPIGSRVCKCQTFKLNINVFLKRPTEAVLTLYWTYSW